MNKKNTVRLISFCAAAVLIAVGFIIKTKQDSNRYKLEVQETYSRSLDSLNSGMNNIYLLLQKAQYVTTPKQLSTMAAQLMSEAENCKTSLSQLPSGEEELTVLNRFLSQVGNYAMTVSKKLIDGGEFTEEFGSNIKILADTAKKIADVINNSEISYNNLDYWAGEVDKKLDSTVSEESLASSLGDLETSLSDYPTLVYDGPFSDHILEKEPLVVKNEEKISELKAYEKAAEITGVKKSDLKYDGMDLGKIPSFRFSNESLSIAISQSGGHVLYLRKTRSVTQSDIDYQKALEKAKAFLSKCENKNMSETYYYTDEGVCVINFAYVDGRTICYTDLIKVGVAMDTGEIMLYESSGFLTNHTERAFETPAVTVEQAKEVVSKKLAIKENALALIPTESSGEVRCYEFVCENEDKQEILVYINATTLEEERILILLKSDGGTLTK